jgi:preprotein translocase subunit SecE
LGVRDPLGLPSVNDATQCWVAVKSLSEELMMDKVKLVLSALLVAAGIAGFYLLADKALVLRILAFLAGIVAAVALFRTTPAGQNALSFVGESISEAKRVVWPTRKETIQTTIAVFVLVMIMAAFLALVDVGFAYMVQWLMGRSA